MPRAIFYRAQKGSLQESEIAVVVQKMVKAEKSGVMFTHDPVRGRQDHLVIEAAYGLGESVVSGMVTPDHYLVNRNDGSLVREFVSVQPIALVYDEESSGTREIELSAEQGSARVLSDDEIRRLLELGIKLEQHFGGPQDIEWSIENGEVYLLQSRPITTL
jgi:pyruvate,water dikinase